MGIFLLRKITHFCDQFHSRNYLAEHCPQSPRGTGFDLQKKLNDRSNMTQPFFIPFSAVHTYSQVWSFSYSQRTISSHKNVVSTSHCYFRHFSISWDRTLGACKLKSCFCFPVFSLICQAWEAFILEQDCLSPPVPVASVFFIYFMSV